MNIFKITGKYLDQPILVAKLNKAFPVALIASGSLYCAHNIKKAPEDDKKNVAIKNTVIMGATITSALLAPQLTNKIFKNEVKNLAEIKKNNAKLVDTYLSRELTEAKTEKILQKAKEKVLSFKEVKHIFNNLKKTKNGGKLLDELVPNPENITSKDIFSEIGRLSVMGLIPVIGGIAGGILGDKLTDSNWKARVPDKVKEGFYQYLANIFLCNVGAGIALGIMEKVGVKSKSGRALGMISGILVTGVLGGSMIANLISNRLINPMFGEKPKKDLYSERKPEALDIGLHVDDIATVAVMSGLKWIEPALPIMYSISGYRAGIGYRNKNINKCNKNKEL